MHQPALDLRRTAIHIRAEPFGFVIFFHQSSAAVRTCCRENRPDHVRTAFREFHTGNFRDDFPAFFYIDVITDANVHLRHHIGIVQCRALDDSSGKLHGIQIRHRRYSPCSTNLIINGFYLRQCLFSLEFERYRPTWEFGGISEFSLICEFIDLDDYSVRRIRKGLALRVPVIDIRLYLIDIVADFPFVGDRKPPRCSSIQRFVVRREIHVRARDMIQCAPKSSSAYLFRIQEFQ